MRSMLVCKSVWKAEVSGIGCFIRNKTSGLTLHPISSYRKRHIIRWEGRDLVVSAIAAGCLDNPDWVLTRIGSGAGSFKTTFELYMSGGKSSDAVWPSWSIRGKVSRKCNIPRPGKSVQSSSRTKVIASDVVRTDSHLPLCIIHFILITSLRLRCFAFPLVRTRSRKRQQRRNGELGGMERSGGGKRRYRLCVYRARGETRGGRDTLSSAICRNEWSDHVVVSEWYARGVERLNVKPRIDIFRT
jgi:hypothetical protein